MLRLLFAAIFVLPIATASKAPCPYSLYQIKVWTTVATEDFSPKWYKDGVTKKGTQKYAIGLGYNDWGTWERRKEIAGYLKGGLTWDEGIEISMKELAKVKTGQSDPYTDLAFRLHAYNTGRCKSVTDLRGCCGAKIGCGSSNRDIRASHNPRRRFEYALATHDFDTVNDMVEGFKDKAAKLARKHKK